MRPIEAGAGAQDQGSGGHRQTCRAVHEAPDDPSRPFIAILGGSESLGDGRGPSYPSLLETAIRRPVANLAAPLAGPDYYLAKPELLRSAARSRIAIVQLPGAEALTNPFYTVHSRRNDRFLAATPALRALFAEVEFTDIHFAGHLHQVLARVDPDRHARVVQVLRRTWLSKMRELLRQLPSRRILLWLPGEPGRDGDASTAALVDPAMPQSLRDHASALVVAVPSPAARAMDMNGIDVVNASARHLPGPAAQAEIAEALLPEVLGLAAPRHGGPLILRPAMLCSQVA